MISESAQDDIIKKVTKALCNYDLGIIVLRSEDGALVLYINDRKSALKDSFKFQQKNYSGGN